MIPEQFLVEWNGKFAMRSLRKIKPNREYLLNQFIIPRDKIKQEKMVKILCHYLRKGIATLNDAYLLSPSSKIIKAKEKTIQQFQVGGYGVESNIIKKRKNSATNEPRKMQKTYGNFTMTIKRKLSSKEQTRKKQKVDLDIDLSEQFVNVRYNVTFTREDRPNPIIRGGFFRNILQTEVDNSIQVVINEYINRQWYPTTATYTFQTEPVPIKHIPLKEEKMYGAVVSYKNCKSFIISNSSTLQ